MATAPWYDRPTEELQKRLAERRAAESNEGGADTEGGSSPGATEMSGSDGAGLDKAPGLDETPVSSQGGSSTSTSRGSSTSSSATIIDEGESQAADEEGLAAKLKERRRRRSLQRISSTLPPGWDAVLDPATLQPIFLHGDSGEMRSEPPPLGSHGAGSSPPRRRSTSDIQDEAIEDVSMLETALGSSSMPRSSGTGGESGDGSDGVGNAVERADSDASSEEGAGGSDSDSAEEAQPDLSMALFCPALTAKGGGEAEEDDEAEDGERAPTIVWGTPPLSARSSRGARGGSSASPSALNAKNVRGATPLHLIVAKGSLEGVAILVDLPLLDLNAKDGDGRTALHIACGLGNSGEAIVDVLLRAGADPAVTDDDGSLPLHIAVANGLARCTRLLLEMGSSAGAVNVAGDTPLHIAALAGHSEIMRLLVMGSGAAAAPAETGSSGIPLGDALFGELIDVNETPNERDGVGSASDREPLGGDGRVDGEYGDGENEKDDVRRRSGGSYLSYSSDSTLESDQGSRLWRRRESESGDPHLASGTMDASKCEGPSSHGVAAMVAESDRSSEGWGVAAEGGIPSAQGADQQSELPMPAPPKRASKERSAEGGGVGPWYQAADDEGNVYFTRDGESVWELPKGAAVFGGVEESFGGSIPEEWAKQWDDEGSQYWYNNWSGEAVWEDPTAKSAGGDEQGDSEEWSQHWGDDGSPYWKNNWTGEVAYEFEDEGQGGGEGEEEEGNEEERDEEEYEEEEEEGVKARLDERATEAAAATAATGSGESGADTEDFGASTSCDAYGASSSAPSLAESGEPATRGEDEGAVLEGRTLQVWNRFFENASRAPPPGNPRNNLGTPCACADLPHLLTHT